MEQKKLEELSELKDFEERTNLPKKALREELEYLGARYLSSETTTVNSLERKIEYMALEELSGNLYVWKRLKGQEDFVIHLETNTVRRY